MRIVYMGTPDFAVRPLEMLLETDHEIVGVVTVADKPSGRGLQPKFSAVKQFAVANGLNVVQPTSLKSEDFLAQLKSFNADLQVVVAFRMLPEVVWAMPKYGTINLHASLLPKYRGAAPINWAIINGEKKTGVTTFFLNHNIDEGNIIFSKEVDIEEIDNAGSLHDKLMEIGAGLVVDTVNAIANNSVVETPQPKIVEAKIAPKIFKQDTKLDFSKTCSELHNYVRGLCPYPAAWIEHNEKAVIKIFETEAEICPHNHKVGEMVSDNKNFAKIALKDGFLHLKNVQLSGKKRMDIRDLLLGYKF